MSRENSLELKVGSFVLLALTGLTFFVVSVADVSFMEEGRMMQAVFGFANGLKDSAPVRLAGVDAGLVKGIKIFLDDQQGRHVKVKVDMWIKQGVGIPLDSQVTINQLGLLGEKYVEIIPGQSQEFAPSGAVFHGSDPVPIEKISEKVSLLTDKLEKTIDGINNGILTDKNKSSVEGILGDMHIVMASIKNGQGTLGKLLMDDSVYQNLDELTVDLKSNPWKLLYRAKK